MGLGKTLQIIAFLGWLKVGCAGYGLFDSVLVQYPTQMIATYLLMNMIVLRHLKPMTCFVFHLPPPPPAQGRSSRAASDCVPPLCDVIVDPGDQPLVPGGGGNCFDSWLSRFIFTPMGCGAAEATDLGFIFVVINPRVWSANRVDLGFFVHKFSNFILFVWSFRLFSS